MPTVPPAPHSSYLEIDGTVSGQLRSAKGGGIRGEVATGRPGYVPAKSVVAVRYQDFVLETGTSLDPRFYEWIGEALVGRPKSASGAVLTVDQKGVVLSRRAFTRAVPSQVTFPAVAV
nr:hypothetical protein [Micromonospora sp. DSM 115978]